MRLYRLLRGEVAVREDFVSHAGRGVNMRPNTPPETARLWDGLSMYETLEQALETAARFPTVWRAVAEMDMSENGTFRLERTTPSPGHWTVWGEPEEVMTGIRRQLLIPRK